MKYSNNLKADLCFLIPAMATNAEDIPTMIMYCNEQTTTEDCNDQLQDWAEEQGIPRECVAFYHALVDKKQKRDLKDLLKAGIVQILFATEALGMVSIQDIDFR
jgi:superfamily II DNA helicase RecQ